MARRDKSVLGSSQGLGVNATASHRNGSGPTGSTPSSTAGPPAMISPPEPSPLGTPPLAVPPLPTVQVPPALSGEVLGSCPPCSSHAAAAPSRKAHTKRGTAKRI